MGVILAQGRLEDAGQGDLLLYAAARCQNYRASKKPLDCYPASGPSRGRWHKGIRCIRHRSDPDRQRFYIDIIGSRMVSSIESARAAWRRYPTHVSRLDGGICCIRHRVTPTDNGSPVSSGFLSVSLG